MSSARVVSSSSVVCCSFRVNIRLRALVWKARLLRSLAFSVMEMSDWFNWWRISSIMSHSIAISLSRGLDGI